MCAQTIYLSIYLIYEKAQKNWPPAAGKPRTPHPYYCSVSISKYCSLPAGNPPAQRGGSYIHTYIDVASNAQAKSLLRFGGMCSLSYTHTRLLPTSLSLRQQRETCRQQTRMRVYIRDIRVYIRRETCRQQTRMRV